MSKHKTYCHVKPPNQHATNPETLDVKCLIIRGKFVDTVFVNGVGFEN